MDEGYADYTRAESFTFLQTLVVRVVKELHSLRKELLRPKGKRPKDQSTSAEYEKELHQLQDRLLLFIPHAHAHAVVAHAYVSVPPAGPAGRLRDSDAAPDRLLAGGGHEARPAAQTYGSMVKLVILLAADLWLGALSGLGEVPAGLKSGALAWDPAAQSSSLSEAPRQSWTISLP